MATLDSNRRTVLFFAIFSIFSGVLLFLNGFLLMRSEMTNIAEQTGMPIPEFDRVIILLIDGLYFGLLPNVSVPNGQEAHMPFLAELLRQSAHGASWPSLHLSHFIADPPTTTLQRIKALITGSMPTFIDAGTNFGGTELLEDHIVKQWALAGKDICFVGDQVWSELVSQGFHDSHPLPSFNIKDLDTVDLAVKEYFVKELSSPSTTCQILIGHNLGIDHCGHTFGRSHPEMDRKLQEFDEFLSLIIRRLTRTDLLVVFGDHGMTMSGDHGGDSDPEVDATFLAYTKRGFPLLRKFYPQTSVAYAPMIAQIDLVPTLAVLTGVPIPFSSLGIVESALLSDPEKVSLAVANNFRQMLTYTREYSRKFGSILIPIELQSHITSDSPPTCHGSDSECLADLHVLRYAFRQQWTRMDAPRIFLGLLIVTNGIIALACFDHPTLRDNLHIRSVFTIPFAVSIVLAFVAPYTVFITAVFAAFFLRFFSVHLFAACMQKHSTLGNLLGVLILAMSAALSLSNSFVVQELRVLIYLLQSFLLLTGVVANRFLRNWKKVFSVQNLLIFFALVFLRVSMHLEVCREESPPTSLCVSSDNVWIKTMPTLVLPSRLQFSIVTGGRLLLALLGVAACFGLHRFKLSRDGNLCGDRLMCITLKALIPLLGLLIMLSWTLDACLAVAASMPKEMAAGNISILAFLKVNTGRLVLLACSFIFFVLIRQPMLISSAAFSVNPHIADAASAVRGSSIELLRTNPLTVTAKSHGSVFTSIPELYISGLGTAYSAWLVSIFGICPTFGLFVLLGDACVVPIIGLFICSLVPVFHIVLRPGPLEGSENNDILSECLIAASSWPCAVYTCFLGQAGFFITGHQTTISAIPWSAAFSIFEGEHQTIALPAILVLSHAFAAQILITSWLPLAFVSNILLAACHIKSESSKKCEAVSEVHFFHSRRNASSFTSALDRLYCRYLSSHLILTFGHLLCAGILRRHLMVWKIFTPRLVYSVCGLLVTTTWAFCTRGLVRSRLHAAFVHWCEQLTSSRSSQYS